MPNLRTLGWAGAAAITLGVGTVGLIAGPYLAHVLILTLLAIALAVSYRLLLLGGEASFCHGTFYGFGAYTVAVLTATYGWNFWLAFVMGGIVAGLGAVLVGVPGLRTRGAYFFLMTFGFLVVANSLLENLSGITGGFSGIRGVPPPTGIVTIQGFFFFALAVCVATCLVFWLLERSSWGLRLRALGLQSDLAESVGTPRTATLLIAFTLGAAFAGLAGGVYATYITFVSPQSFHLWVSVVVLTYVVVGGARYLSGAVTGAVVLSLIPVIFNWSQNLVGMIAAALTLLIMLLAPRGIVGEIVERVPAGMRTTPPQPGRTTRKEPVASAANDDRSRDAEQRTPVLLVEGIGKRFGGLTALDGVSMTMGAGETVGLIGPNGAGKTTFFNVISGFYRPDQGAVHLDGRSITGLAPHRVAKAGLARTFQAATTFDELTALENVLVGASAFAPASRIDKVVRPASRSDSMDRASELLDLVGLADHANDLAGGLPYGRKRLLGVAVALAASPTVLCLDEPVTGMTGAEVSDMVSLLHTLKTSGISILLVEHRMPVVMNVCDRIFVLNFGKILAVGTPKEIQRDERVIDAYLGPALDVPASGGTP